MKAKRVAIYTRVSTTDQDPEMQERELLEYVERRGWTLYKTFSDKGVSGSQERRPGLDSLLAECRRGRVDIVVVWKFDRFARSVKQLVDALELFRELGIGFVSCTEAIDTSLPHGSLMFALVAGFAEFERSLITERVKAGLRHARERGQRLGRPPLRQLTREETEQVRKERQRSGMPFRELAKKHGISVWAAHRICRRVR
jgi:DNA invertase Pin-like site-specific DNA recombinase